MSKSEYRRSIKPKKSLGQHFLKNDEIAERIAQTVPENGLPVLEVGAGTGALTKHLIRRFPNQLYLNEIDQRSIEVLNRDFPTLQDKIFTTNFLELNLPELFPNGLNVIGNYPYNISSQIVINAIDNRATIVELSGMFQKELAERITAKEGNKQYGQLSVITQFYFNCEYLFTVDKSNFDPPPKVQSGVIQLQRKEKLEQVNERLLKQLVKQAFSQRRKKLRNTLSSFFPKEYLQQDIFDLRPEQLSLSDFIDLTNQSVYFSK